MCLFTLFTFTSVQVLFNFLTMMRHRKAEALEAAGQELQLLALDQGSVTAALDAHSAREAKRARRGSPPGSTSTPLLSSSSFPCPASPSRLLRMADSAVAAGGGGTFALLGGGGGGGGGGGCARDGPAQVAIASAIAPRLRSAPQRRSSLASLMAAAAQLPASSSAAASASEAAAAAAQALAVQEAASEATWRRVSHAYPQLERNFFSRRAEAEAETEEGTGAGAQVRLPGGSGLMAASNPPLSSFPAASSAPSQEAAALTSPPSSSSATSTLPEHLRSFSHDLQQYSRYSRFDVAACLQYGESEAVLGYIRLDVAACLQYGEAGST